MRAGGAPAAALLLVAGSLLTQTYAEDIYWEGEEDAVNEYLEVKEGEELTAHPIRIKRANELIYSAAQMMTTTTTARENDDSVTAPDDNDDDLEADGSGSRGFGEVEPKEKTLRVSFVVIHPYQKEYSNRDSPMFQNFSQSLANAVTKLYQGNRDIQGTQRAYLVRIQSRASDDFSCKVTLDIVTTGYDNMDKIKEILRDHIRYKRALDNLAVSDADFNAKVIDPGANAADNLCASNEISCGDGNCLPSSARCNGITECFNGADETGCPQDCQNDELKCDETRCVALTKRCDGVSDCDDRTDELNCESESCGVDDFRCNNGKCIPSKQRCDHTVDCPTQEDEMGCDCSANEFQCVDDRSCIEKRKLCDRINHCRDGSDEQNCANGGQTCPPEQVACAPGTEVPCATRCDGVPECAGATDEQDCFPEDTLSSRNSEVCYLKCDDRCLDQSQICDGFSDCSDNSDEYMCDDYCQGPDDFRCNSGECIGKKQHCNDLPDCPDESDEIGCNKTMIPSQECDENQFTCNNGVCIDSRFVCDRNFDCVDNSDEENCNRCGPNEWQCRSGECIQREQQCDGSTDCPDSSDETSCSTPSPIAPFSPNPDRNNFIDCDEYQWQCHTGQCIQREQECDGTPDCSDGSDERDCRTHPEMPIYPGCFEYQWKCTTGQCIQRDQRCDGTPDCPDGSDEKACQSRPITSRPIFPKSPAGLKLKTYPDVQIVRNANYQTGGDVVFQCRDEGSLRAPVRWVREGGRPLKPGSSDVKGRLEMAKVTVSDSGIYICQAPGYLGSPEAELRVTLTVQNSQQPEAIPFSTCQSYEATCNNGQCISKLAVCDGKNDCADNSDEDNCNVNGVCEPNQFQCDNHRCVLKTWVCDMQDDCGDGSDERNCGESRDGNCSPSEFTCGDRQCIPKSFHCDGQRDCMDNTDEVGCAPIFIVKSPQPQNVKLNPGEKLTLECEAIGVPEPLITWRLNWGHVPTKCTSKSDAGVGSLTCPDMQPEDSGAYSCEAINNKGTTFAGTDSIVQVNNTDICPSGSFNNEARTPNECIRCFCFGESKQCKSADLFIYNMPTPLGQGGTRLVGVQQSYNGEVRIDPQPISDQYYYNPLINGATVTKLENYRGYPAPTVSSSYPYLTLPESYNGNQLTSYGGHIKYKLTPHSPRLSSGYDNMPDIIIKGKFETIVYNRRRNDPRETNIEVRLTQANWQKSGNIGLVVATREDIMMALTNVEFILLKASHNGVGVNITDFVMESAQGFNAGLGAANLVEECKCPPGYEGLSCQKCSSGYVRESSGAWLGNCVREAPRACPPGTYGDPNSGYGCQSCPCPLTDRKNQFANTCALGPRGNVVCDCEPGYEGDRCEYCARGFVGNPLVPGDSCQRKRPSNCDPVGTSRILLHDVCECKENVQGQFCNECKNNSFHLSADSRHGCTPCFCMGETQQCTSSNLRRRTVSVAYNIPQIVEQVQVYESAPFAGAGVVRYDAPVSVAARPQLVRGELAFGAQDRSKDNIYYWSLPHSFAGDIITSYGGYLRYVLRNVPTSGIKNNAADIYLISHNRVTFHYFGNFEPSSDGTVNASVQLLEKGWQRADGKEKSRIFFLLALADVKAILIKATYTGNSQMATLVSSSIDTATADGDGPVASLVEQCWCPPGYIGTSCEDCAPGYTRSPDGLYLMHCMPCDCNGHSDSCDPESGVCLNCRDNTAGARCDQCKQGYDRDTYGNCVLSREPPQPYSCNCDSRGQAEPCDARGYCHCKQNVEGESCDTCRPGSFGLDQDNPEGCTPCYCSGVTRDCFEATNFARIQISAPIIGENNGNYTITDLNARQVFNDEFVVVANESELIYVFNFPTSDELYWSLPRFSGNMLLSYGGNLALTQGFRTNLLYPTSSIPGMDVILVGDENSVYWTNPQQIISEQPLKYQVPLIERDWYILNSHTPASRADFMSVLKNLRRVLVKATLTPNIFSTTIADVSMDTARPASGFELSTAKGIEACRCPQGYTGQSCESCSPGYYVNRGRCQQCNCNGHDCHVGSYDEVICDCRAHYSGPDCSIIDGDSQVTTTRLPPPQSTVTVTISSPIIRIKNVGGFVNFTCEARSRMTQQPLPVQWTKVDGYLPQGRVATDPATGTLYISRVQESDSGTYVCETTDGISTGRAMATLTVGSNSMTIPTVSIRPPVNEYHEGDRIELECMTTGNPTPKITWQRANGEALPIEIEHYESYLIIESARKEDSGQYRCIARNAAGSTDRIAVISVRPKPSSPIRDKLTISQKAPNVVEGQSTNIICTGTANIPPGSIGWVRQDGAELSSNLRSDNGILYIDVARLENQGVYVCQTSSQQAASVPIVVSVLPLNTPPPSERSNIAVNVERLKIPTGGSGTVDCNPLGYPEPYIEWKKHQGEFGAGTSQRGNMLVITNAQDDDQGYYVCTGSVDGTPVANIYVMVEIETRIRPQVEIYPVGDQAAPLGGEFEFICRVVAGVPAPEILWSRGKGRLQQLSAFTHIQPHGILKFEKIEVNDEGEYICTATNSAGTASANATLKVRSLPEITLTPSSYIEVNQGQRIDFQCRANGYPEPMVSIKSAPDFRVIAGPSPGIATLSIPSASDRDNGDYTCSAESAAGNIDEQFAIRVDRGDVGFSEIEGSGETEFEDPYNPTEDRVPRDLIAREGEESRLRCELSNVYDARWERDRQPLQRNAEQIGNVLVIHNTSKSDSGQYECVLIDRNTGYPHHSAYTNLVVLAPPRITLRPRTQTVHPGQSPTVECIVEGDDILEVTWKPAPRPYSSRVQIRGNTLIFRQIEVEDAGEYVCFAKNRVAEASATAQVIVHGPREEAAALVSIDQPRRPYAVDENVEVVCRAASRGVRVWWERIGTTQHVVQQPYGDGSALRLSNVAESDAGVYRCFGEDVYRRRSFDDFTLEVIPGSASKEPSSYVVNEPDVTYTARLGDAVQLSCPHDLEQPVSFEWKREFSSLPSDVRPNEQNLYLNQVSEVDAGTYICSASNSRTRTESRVVLLVKGVVPQFNGDSWLAMEPLQDAYLRFDIEISFKPADNNGLILYNGEEERGNGNFIALQLLDAVPQMILGTSSSPVIVKGDQPLKLDTWHTIRMSRMHTKVSMNVDDTGPFTAELPKHHTMDLKQALYIGGVPDRNQLPSALAVAPSFVGCVGMLVLGKQEKDVMMDSSDKYRVGECDSCSPNRCLHGGICQEARNERGYVCLCPVGFAGRNCDHAGEGCRPGICGPGKCTETADSYKCSCPITYTGPNCNIQQSIEYPAFRGSAYLAIKTPESGRSLHISMKIKAMSPVTDGIIMYCAESESGYGGFTSLTVHEGRLEFRYQLGDGSSPVILTSNYPLVAKEWTEVKIARTGAYVLLRVSHNSESVQGRLDNPTTELHLTTALYVGGVDDTNIVLNNNTGVTGGFSGCIKDVIVQAGPINIVNASIVSANVQECSIYNRGDIPEDVNVCSLCRNNGRCARPDATACSCPPGYAGTYCERRTQPDTRRAPFVTDPCRDQPCMNRATCRPDRSSALNFTCDCPLGFAGSICQMSLTLSENVRFSGNGYLELASDLLNYNDNPAVIALAINVSNDNGVLLYQRESSAGPDDGDYILLRVEHGHVVFEWDQGAGPTMVAIEDVEVSNMDRHLVIVKMFRNNEVELTVDQKTKTETYRGLTNRMNADSNIYLGGIPERLNVHNIPGLTGCVQSVVFTKTDRSLDLALAVAGRNAQRCKEQRY